MKLFGFVVFILNVFLIYNVGSGQVENFKEDFFYPLKIHSNLAGNFGEPREYHFHTGVDFRTYTENVEVFSVCDGYVSFISVSPWIYGLTLHVTHPNGYTSVYAHLNRFKPEIQDFIRMIQYEKKTYSIDTVIAPNLFPVKGNDLIAYSGNTGFSEGPHLHFELRETESNILVNTVNNIYRIKDNIKPDVYFVVVYPLSDTSVVDGKNQKKQINLFQNQYGTYCPENNIKVRAKGDVGLGVCYVDRMNDVTNRFGVESVKLYVNDSLYYYSLLSKVDMTKQSCKNSLFDYSYFINKSLHVHKTFVEPNNDLDIFEHLINTGVFNVSPGDDKRIRIEITDYNGNTSNVRLNILGDKLKYSFKNTENIKWNKTNILLFESCRVEIDSASMFCDDFVTIRSIQSRGGLPAYNIGNHSIALKKHLKFSFFMDEGILKYKDKIYVVNSFNKYRNALIVTHEGDFATVFSNNFGDFYIAIDTVAPEIIPKNIFKGVDLSYAKYIELEIKDNTFGVGIGEYNLYINDIWVFGQYEPKTQKLKYYFDEYFPTSDKYEFKAIVSDKLGNTKEFVCIFNKSK